MTRTFWRLGILTLAFALGTSAQTGSGSGKRRHSQASPPASQQDVQALRELVQAQQKQIEAQNQQLQAVQGQLLQVLDSVRQEMPSRRRCKRAPSRHRLRLSRRSSQRNRRRKTLRMRQPLQPPRRQRPPCWRLATRRSRRNLKVRKDCWAASGLRETSGCAARITHRAAPRIGTALAFVSGSASMAN